MDKATAKMYIVAFSLLLLPLLRANIPEALIEYWCSTPSPSPFFGFHCEDVLTISFFDIVVLFLAITASPFRFVDLDSLLKIDIGLIYCPLRLCDDDSICCNSSPHDWQ
ncbi:hypothetical protein CFP56_001010 [Quercus suber]|uniref:Uncharacterized protein n=1 Tax=Quercus suber TaxID=58331 RepID=A0AAW0LHL6_QUESU